MFQCWCVTFIGRKNTRIRSASLHLAQLPHSQQIQYFHKLSRIFRYIPPPDNSIRQIFFFHRYKTFVGGDAHCTQCLKELRNLNFSQRSVCGDASVLKIHFISQCPSKNPTRKKRNGNSRSMSSRRQNCNTKVFSSSQENSIFKDITNTLNRNKSIFATATLTQSL